MAHDEPAFDLHCHTTYSDGLADPFDLARIAWASGVQGVAVTDHDTVAHFGAAADACATFGLAWIPAVELSAEVPPPPGVGGPPRSVHLLGYWIEDGDNPLTRELERLRRARRDRALAMIAAVNAAGAGIDAQAVLAAAGDASVGRPHVARAMVAAGVVATPGQAFAEWLGEDRPAYVAKGALDPVRAVQLIRSAGGAAVLAHPTWGGVDRGVLDAMCSAGLAGIESPKAAYDADAAMTWHRVAAARDLVLTHGTDFHGTAGSPTVGTDRCSVGSVEELGSRAGGEPSQW
jgi:predicted metal-dependent phosphoesterase TrpH